jgi:phage baseplate assembly protein gpV
MTQRTVSDWHFYSHGVVAENKAANTDVVEVTPLEKHAMLDGELTPNTTALESSGVDGTGSAYTTKSQTAATIPCKWRPVGESNRKTSPDVRRGEQVEIWRFADTDQFYWSTMSNDSSTRKLEHVVMGYSGTAEEDVDASNDNHYTCTFSPLTGAITIHTSKANSEPFAFDISLNTKAGTLTVDDNTGNLVKYDFGQNQFHVENPDGAVMDLTGTAFKMSGLDSFEIDSKKISLSATDSYELDTADSTINSTTTTITSETTHNGSVAVAGDLTTAAGSDGKSTGKAKFGGDMEVTGSLTADQDVTAVNGTVSGKQIVSQEAIVAPNV